MTTEENTAHTGPGCAETAGIRVTVNGAERRLPVGTALAAFLKASGVPARFIAVAVNREVVRRDEHGTVILEDGDVVEIVRMVGGGSDEHGKSGCAPAARGA